MTIRGIQEIHQSSFRTLRSEPLYNTVSIHQLIRTIKAVRIFSHRYLIEFYETNRMSHVPHLYDIVILLK